MLMPKVSIIIPVYNVDYCLKECLDSVITQTYKNIEIILIDDGSNDDSGKICDEYAIKDKRIKVIHNSNNGVSYSRNVGINISTGKYILFIDSDDIIDKNYVLCLLEPTKWDDYDLVLCNICHVYRKKKRDRIVNIKINDKLVGDLKYDYFYLRDLMSYPVLKLYKNSIIKKYNVFFKEDISLAEDQLFNYRYLKFITKYKFVNKHLYYYIHRNGKSLSDYLTLKNFNDYIKKLKEEKIFFKEMNILNGNLILNDHAINFIDRFVLIENYSDNSYNDFKNRVSIIKSVMVLNSKSSNIKRKIILMFLKYNILFPIYIYIIE